ncbi:MAG: hypothetical protein SXA11_02555 [Cyanobacteriota bacterium]|nr:hypothetical protein [Cyanobacteriota bacterium]
MPVLLQNACSAPRCLFYNRHSGLFYNRQDACSTPPEAEWEEEEERRGDRYWSYDSRG